MPLAGLADPIDPWRRQLGKLEVSDKNHCPVHPRFGFFFHYEWGNDDQLLLG